MNAWTVTKVVRFAHCDPAGIVFYPRFFDIVHEVLEDWFSDALRCPFRELIVERGLGFPIVRLATEFRAASRLGDELTVALSVPRLGGASMSVDYAVSCRGEPRLDIRTVIVQTDLATGRARAIDGALRERIEQFRNGAPASAVGGTR